MTEQLPDAYVEARIDVPRDRADIVCDFIIENIAGGLVIEEEENSPVTGITFYVPCNGPGDYKEKLAPFLEKLLSDLPGGAPKIRESTIKNVEWVEQYKSSIKPILIGDDVVVRPTWDIAPVSAKYVLTLEPKMAFGTGSHETTRSCLKVIRQSLTPGARFLDLGCGSGILSILASKMGAGYILALDNDVAAVENCRENFVINEVSTPHDVLFGSIDRCDPKQPFDFVCVNIIKSVILPMLDRLISQTAPGGILVLSGLLDQDEEDITNALSERHCDRYTIMRDNQWLTFTVEKS